ncbi:MAG: hypothetical protein P8184_08900 [Calditrichia bacterium]
MIDKFLKKYGLVILLFCVAQAAIYLGNFNSKAISPHLNFALYFLSYILISENLKRTILNRTLISLFQYFYFFLSIPLGLFYLILLLKKSWYIPFYQYTEIIISFFLLLISVYLATFLFKINGNKSRSFFRFSLFISFVIIMLLYKNFLFHPFLLANKNELPVFFEMNYQVKFLGIFGLLVFWIAYYQKKFVLSEYLNIILFFFTISMFLDAFFYVMGQHDLKVFVESQYANLSVNFLMTVTWWVRLSYLKLDIAKVNENYLVNYDYLKNLVPKPRAANSNKILASFYSNPIALSVAGISFIAVLLILISEVSMFLVLNTVIILILGIMAVMLSIIGLKRDWKNQIGFFLSNKRKPE